MMKNNKGFRNGCAMLIVALVLLLTAAPALAASGSNPIPPRSQPYGKSYSEWSGLWWIWAFGMPANNNPLIDPTGEKCTLNQSGPVWYLAGTYVVEERVIGQYVGQAERSCTVPPGKALFVPVFNAECSTVEGDGTTYDELRACAKGLMDSVTLVQATWDGAPIAGDPMSAAFRFKSPLMTFILPGPAPEDNILDLAPGPSVFASDGYYVMLTPPTPGKHTLHMYGVADLGGGNSFTLDVTYHLTIAP